MSRWLSGSRQLVERNRLPGAVTMAEIAAVLELPTERAGHLVRLGEDVDRLRGELEQAERGWRSRAGEYLTSVRAAEGAADSDEGMERHEALHQAADGVGEDKPGPALGRIPEKVALRSRTVPLLPAALITVGMTVAAFVFGTLVASPSPESKPPGLSGGTTPPVEGEKCSPWTETVQGVQLEGCIRVRQSRMLIRVRMRGPVGTRADIAVQVYDTFLERGAGRELGCHRMYILVEGEIQTCGYHEVRPPYGSEYAARALWKKEGEIRFGNPVISPGTRW
ncbi:hypothetical protein [Rhizohabitans arisaemae]|uniref:hypothetical protein n=1 Tax=Rhizohabitans arisaemae TaxID=2720610 RepID=UPI0024B11685|nr:hypothetical protein [Rhizohabitans arisaemae]